jgi:hypothetical protein
VAIIPAGTTTTSLVQGAINTTSVTMPTAPGAGAEFLLPITAAAGIGFINPTGTTRISVASTTTVYLVVSCNFAISTASAYGFIRARRVR